MVVHAFACTFITSLRLMLVLAFSCFCWPSLLKRLYIRYCFGTVSEMEGLTKMEECMSREMEVRELCFIAIELSVL